MGVNSLPKTVTRQRRSCDLNPGPFAPESSMLLLTTGLPSALGPVGISTKLGVQRLPCFVHIAYGRESVLPWRRCDTLCASGFADDVIFAYNGQCGCMSCRCSE